MHRSVFLLLFSVLLLACSACRKQGESESAAADSLKTAAAPLASDEQGPSVSLDAPLPLMYRFAKGDTFGYRINKVERVTMTQDTIIEKNFQTVTYWYTFTVLEGFGEGGGRLKAECDRVSFSGSYDGPKGKKKMAFDSKDANSHDIEKLYANYNAAVNTPFEIVVAANGGIADVTKLENVVRNFLKDDYATTKSDQLAAITQEYAQTALKGPLQMIFQNLSDTPVSKDSSWAIMQPVQLGFLNYRNNAEYVLSDVTKTANGRLAHITTRITSTFTGKRTMDTGQGLATMKDFDVTGSGRATYNIDKARVHRRALNTAVFVKMYVEPPGAMKKLNKIQKLWWSNNATVEDSVEPYTR